MIPVLIGLIRTLPEERDLNSINENNLKAEILWSILDDHLKNHKWISSNNFSIADICCGVWVWRRYELDTKKNNLKNIDRWFNDLKERSSYRKIVMKPLS